MKANCLRSTEAESGCAARTCSSGFSASLLNEGALLKRAKLPRPVVAAVEAVVGARRGRSSAAPAAPPACGSLHRT